MSFFAWLQKAFARRGQDRTRRDGPDANHDDGDFAAVLDVSRLLARDEDSYLSGAPLDADAADIPLVLGNLFRAQGDIDRAVSLRKNILALAGADQALRARAWFEMGRDYRKAGLLDRAFNAYREARKLGYAPESLGEDLMQLHADSGDFVTAASEAALLGNGAAEAFYIVRQAEESAAQGKDDQASRLLRHAVAVYDGSAEAWLALATMSLLGGNVEKALERMRSGLDSVSPSGRLILLEGLYSFIRGPSAPNIARDALSTLAKGLEPILDEHNPDITLCYYAGLFLHAAGMPERAEQWYTKALVLDPDFWAARLAILALAAGREDLPPLLERQIAFFTEQGARSKRFLCPPCGLRRETIFSQCPRCRAWHSAAFRLRLT